MNTRSIIRASGSRSPGVWQTHKALLTPPFEFAARTPWWLRMGASPHEILRNSSGPIQNPGMHGKYESLVGGVMVANLNCTVAVVSTLSKVSLISICLGEVLSDAWPKFFYSLGFKSWVAPHQSAAMAQAIAGTWTIATATAADQFTFSTNGRYGGASAAQSYNLMASGTVLTTTQAFFGDGAYTLKGNAITLTPDDRSRPAQVGWIHLEQESKDGGNAWSPFLYLLRTSTVDGKEYEVRYKKTK
jgi:hypothetical protein